jgi:hypothetical protein
VVGGGNTTPFYTRGLGVTAGDDGVIPPCYGASAGARTAGVADGLGVRRAHRLWRGGAVRGALGEGQRREVWASGGARPQAEERWEGTRARAPRVGRHAADDARHTGARRRGALAPGLKQFC